jgi:hypothetical protein
MPGRRVPVPEARATSITSLMGEFAEGSTNVAFLSRGGATISLEADVAEI